MPTFCMLIGVPGAGKSFWIEQQPIDWNKTVLISTDAIIDQRAAAQSKTYDQVFALEIKSATAETKVRLARAVANNLDIIIDQTNVSVNSRKAKLSKIPAVYDKIAVFFATPQAEEHQRRLQGRVGKTIPDHVIQGMMDQLTMPTKGEGFDRIIHVDAT